MDSREEGLISDEKSLMEWMDSLCEDDDGPIWVQFNDKVATTRFQLNDEDDAAKRQILQRLAALGIASCEVEYNGSDGMRSMFGCHGAGPDGKPLSVPADVDSLVEDFVGRTLPRRLGRRIGESRHGDVRRELRSGRLRPLGPRGRGGSRGWEA